MGNSMIDVHCHLLPFIDDGARDWEAAMAMARTAVGYGTTQIIVTPHWTGAPGERETILERLAEFRTRARAEGLPLTMHTGNEVVLVPRLLDALKEGQAFTLGGSSYLLLETAQLEQGAFTHAALFQLQSHGYRVILAHPERVRSWQHSVEEVRELIQRGCYLQVNAGSLMGGFGNSARKTAEEFLRRGWVSLLATDAHSPNSRPPLLGQAFSRCAELIGAQRALKLVEENPARVLRDQELPYVDTDAPVARRGFLSFLWPWSDRSASGSTRTGTGHRP
jgi:protein-tyrosine phosphatase